MVDSSLSGILTAILNAEELTFSARMILIEGGMRRSGGCDDGLGLLVVDTADRPSPAAGTTTAGDSVVVVVSSPGNNGVVVVVGVAGAVVTVSLAAFMTSLKVMFPQTVTVQHLSVGSGSVTQLSA